MGTVGLSVTDPGRPDTGTVTTLELVFRATNDLRMTRSVLIFVLVRITNVIIMTALFFIAAITAISHAVAFPPEGHTLLVAALEHPLVANTSRESRLRRVCPVPWSNQAVAFVTLVGAVGVAVAPPCLEDAMTIVALKLPVLAALHLVAVLFIAVVRTVLITVTNP